MKRIYRAAYCPDGWRTIEEYDDCVAVMRGQSIEITQARRINRGVGRPLKYATDAEAQAAKRAAQQRYKRRKAS